MRESFLQNKLANSIKHYYVNLMSLTIAYNSDQIGLTQKVNVPVFYDLEGMRDFHTTKSYIKRCILNAGITQYGIFDTNQGYDVALEGLNASIRFMYFFEGDKQQESELRFFPETEDQAQIMMEWLAELTHDLKQNDKTELYIEQGVVVLKFHTREANVRTYFQIQSEMAQDYTAQQTAKKSTNTPPQA